jgi:hypothetical protein
MKEKQKQKQLDTTSRLIEAPAGSYYERFEEQTKPGTTPGIVKRLLPPRQSRGFSRLKYQESAINE